MWYAIFAMRDYAFHSSLDEIVIEGDYDTLVIDKQSVKTIGYNYRSKDMIFAVAAQLFYNRGYNPVNYSGFIGMFKA